MDLLKSKKVIWLVNKHAAPIQYNATNMRTFKLAYYLQEMGFDVRIFSSGFIHNRNIELIKNDDVYQEGVYAGVRFVHIKTAHYKSNGVKRIYSLYEFGRKLYKYRNHWDKPDAIVHTSNIPFDIFVLWCAKRLKAQYVSEIVDLWPESFVAFGLLKSSNPILRLFYRVEKYVYSKADKVVFSMEGGKDYIREKKWNLDEGGTIDLNKVFYLNNGVDVIEFEDNVSKFQIEDADLVNDKVKRVVYLGSIRLVNDLMTLIQAAAVLKHRSDVLFLIYGDGDDRERLEKYCLDNEMNNVRFKQKWVEPQYVPYILNRSTINIVNYKANSVERFGGSQNKLFQALASGRPICSNVGMGYSIIKRYDVGIDEKFDSPESYAGAIMRLLDSDKQVYDLMCQRAKEAALDFDLRDLASKYLKILGYVNI